jgi:hypothetical protein
MGEEFGSSADIDQFINDVSRLYTGNTNRIFKKFNPKNKDTLKQSEFLRVAKKVLPNYTKNDLTTIFYDFDPPDA